LLVELLELAAQFGALLFAQVALLHGLLGLRARRNRFDILRSGRWMLRLPLRRMRADRACKRDAKDEPPFHDCRLNAARKTHVSLIQ